MKPIAPDIIQLYDAYTHGSVSRRAFMARLSRLAGGAAAASALLPLLANDYARAATIAQNDPRLAISTAKFATGAIVDLPAPSEVALGGPQETFTHVPFVTAYSARLKKSKNQPAVIVIHENRGLNPHIQDIARRLALEGFAAYAVDMLSPIGGTPADEDRARTLIGKLNREKTALKLAAVAESLSADKRHQGRVGAVGFCWGGGMVNALAAAAGDALGAGVVYYGRQASAEEAARIKSRLLFHYAGRDERINAGIADYENALRGAGVSFASYVHPDVDHAFNNDTNAARYDQPTAARAWAQTIAFLKESLA